MPISVECPKCNAILKAPDEAAGKRARCKGCGHVMTVEAPAPVIVGRTRADDDDHEEDDDEDGPAPPPREPWYYGFCHGMSTFLLAMTVMLGCIGLMLGVGSLIGIIANAKDEAGVFMTIAASVLYFIPTIVGLVMSIYAFSFVLVFVDAARHVRRIYHKDAAP